MTIDKDTVRYVALLARLEISEQDLERYARELSSVLDYVARLDELGVEGVEPADFLHQAAQPPREDVAGVPRLPRAEALAQAPATDGAYFLVPPVVEYLEP